MATTSHTKSQKIWKKVLALMQGSPLVASAIIYFITLELKLYVWLHLDRRDLPFQTLAVVMVGAIFGLREALFVSVLSIIAKLYYFIEPSDSFRLESAADAIEFVLFALVSLVVGIVLGRQKKIELDLQKLLRKQRDWLATVSHEVRTPLNGIIGLSRLLAETPLSDEQKKFTTLINSSSDRLRAIVTDMLDISRIESDKVIIEDVVFNPKIETQKIFEIFSIKAKSKNISLVLQTDLADRYVKGDLGKYLQVLSNLVDNAIKFSSHGSVKIEVEVVEVGLRKSILKTSVSDSGPGISKSELDHIFEPFFRSENVNLRQTDGVGLGLSISLRLVKILHGRIWVESVVGQGSAFHFEIEVAVTEKIAEGFLEKSAGISLNDSRDQTVLVVEDNSINRLVITKYLERLGFRSDCVNNGVEGVQAIMQFDYDFILMDCYMPIMDGFRATMQIRELLKNKKKQTKIIGITADVSENCIRQGLKSGMDILLKKPISEFELFEAISSFLNSENLPQGISIDELNRQTRILGTSVSNEICTIFLREMDSRMRELTLHFEKRDSESLKNRAHNLKSSCLAIKALFAAKLCGEIDDLATDADKFMQIDVNLRALRREMDFIKIQIAEMNLSLQGDDFSSHP